MTPSTVPTRLHPTTATIADHLTIDHVTTGLTPEQISATPAAELLRWHDVDHRHVASHYLGHDHGATATTDQPRDPDEIVHRDTLRAVREGKPVANLDEILRRATAVTIRIARAERAKAAGEPRQPGDGVVSPYDRRCLEIADAVAARAAGKAKRRGRAA